MIKLVLTMNKKADLDFPKKVLSWLVGLAAASIAVHLLLQYLNLEVFYQQQGQIYELSNRFDLDDEASFPTWVSQFLFLSIAMLAFASSYFSKTVGQKNVWRVIGLGGLMMSIDEIAGLHEYLLQTVHVIFFRDASPTSLDNAWLILAPFIVAGSLILFWFCLKNLPKRTVSLLAFATFTFLMGAVVIDVLISVSARETFLNQGLMVAIEEGLELIGLVIGVYAIANYLDRAHTLKIVDK